MAVDDVRDASFQRPQRLLFGFAFGDLLVVVDPSWGFEADLGDRGGVDGVVQFPVSSPRQPVPFLTSRRVLDGGGAVVSGVAASRTEPGDVAGVADQERSDDGPDFLDIGHRGVRGGDRSTDQCLVGGDPGSVRPNSARTGLNTRSPLIQMRAILT